MARSTDPLRRDNLEVVARLPTARVEAPRTNAALQLADSLARLTPEAQRTMQGIAEKRAESARAQAKKDAIQASGAQLADAVRSGTIRPTQNPWYVDAYNRESAAIRATDGLQKLQTQSAGWDEKDDPQAFAERWRKEVGSFAEGFEGTEQIAGFSAAEQAVTSQVLQQNVARNAQRIETERVNNLGMLASDAIGRAYVSSGGRLSPNQVWDAIAPAREQWFATGGDQDGWNKIVVAAVTSTAYGTKQEGILDLLRAPELLYGPSDAGTFEVIAPDSAYQGVTVTQVDPGPSEVASGGEAAQAAPTLTVSAPKRGFSLAMPVEGRISSGFGQRAAPMAGASTDHGGIDIAAPAGTPIKAQAVGRVVSAQREGNAGNVVRVDYGNGVVASYAHMSSFSVQEGDMVAPGQSLGGVGRTGNATGNHLHYVLRVNGERVDPTQFRGQVGGEFAGVTQSSPQAVPSQPGFPGADRPYQSQPLQNTYAAGPSLYGLPGVADQIESDRYRISAAAEAAPLQRMRELENQRKERAFAGRDFIYQRYGTAVLTGGVTRNQIIEDLGGQGFSAPEIALALNFIRDPLSDSVAVANAQVAARQQNPGNAVNILDLALRGTQEGYSPGYEQQVQDAILRGDISGSEGQSMVQGSLSRTRQIESEARADRSEARAQARFDEANSPGEGAKTATALKQQADNLAAATAVVVQRVTGVRNVDEIEAAVGANILRVARAHLATNPGDWDGAYAAARAEAARQGRALRQRAQQRQQPQQNNPRGGNPRR